MERAPTAAELRLVLANEQSDSLPSLSSGLGAALAPDPSDFAHLDD